MKLIDIIKEQKIYGIIREDNAKVALERISAYIEGGIKLIEINAPLEVTKAVSKFDNVIIAQGGVITTSQAHEALKAGAQIISSPIFQTNLTRFSSCYKTFLIPSVTTANEAYSAWRSRIPLVKIYPVSEMGGIEYIKDLMKPMPFLSLLPCGFVKLDEIKEYLNAGAVAVGLGRELYAKTSYEDIVKTVKEAVRMVR